MGSALVALFQSRSEYTLFPHPAAVRARVTSSTPRSVIVPDDGLDDSDGRGCVRGGPSCITDDGADVSKPGAAYMSHRPPVGQDSPSYYTVPGVAFDSPSPCDGGSTNGILYASFPGGERADGAENPLMEAPDEMGPMDCADAYLYYHPPGASYAHVESAVLRHPDVARLSRNELRDRYQGVPDVERQTKSPPLQPPLPHTPTGGEVARARDRSSSTARRRTSASTSSFHSLVEELHQRCLRRPGEAVLAWRNVDHATRLAPPATKTLETVSRLVHGTTTVSSANTAGPQRPLEEERLVYYMGPTQYMSYGELWDKIEIFGWGLRALGLAPGDMVGLLEDTRWELLVAAYAAWSQAFIVVVLHDSPRCWARATAEARGLKAVVCKQTALGPLRQHFRRAQLAHGVDEPESTAGDGEEEDVGTSQEPRLSHSSHPLFIVTRPLHPSVADDVEGPAAARTSSTGTTSRMGDEEEEALWWSDVLQQGEKARAVARGMHQREREAKRQLRRKQRQKDRLTRCQQSSPSTSVGVASEPHHHGTGEVACSSAWVDGVGSSTSTTNLTTILSGPRTTEECAPLFELMERATVSTGTISTATIYPPPAPSSAVCNSFQASQKPHCRMLSAPPHSTARPHVGGGSRADWTVTPVRSTDLAMIVYAGGDPKGVMLTQGALKASVTGYWERLQEMHLFPGMDLMDACLEEPLETSTGPAGLPSLFPAASALSGGRWGARRCTNVQRPSYLALLPFTHITEFVAETAHLFDGYLVCFGSPATLFGTSVRPHGDLHEYKPLVVASVPHMLDRLVRSVQETLTSGYRKLLFDVGYEARRQALRRGLETPFLNSSVFWQPRQLLGGRCRAVFSVGSPLPPRIHEFLQVVCGVSVVQVYGPAEVAGCGMMQLYWSAQIDNMGGPIGPVEVKVRDTGKWRHDGERVQGELLLRGPSIMAGYYCQPERTAEVLEPSGWLHTGDVVERLSDGTFRLICRLTQEAWNMWGERIAVEALEELYSSHPLCLRGGVCLLVHPYRSYICALLLTDETRTDAFLRHQARAARDDIPMSHGRWPYCLRDPEFNAAVAASLARFAADSGARHYELVHRVRVLYDDWRVENGVRTATGRLIRHALEHRYRAVIEELFSEEM